MALLPSSSAPGLSVSAASLLYSPLTPRVRLAGYMPTISDDLTAYTTNGTTQLSSTDKIGFRVYTACTRLKFTFINGTFVNATGILQTVGNPITFKSYLQISGNLLPMSFGSNANTSMTTPVITANNVTTTTGSVSTQTVVVTSTANIPLGSTISDITTTGSTQVISVVNGTTLKVYPPITYLNGDTITVTSYPGQGTVLGDGQLITSYPIGTTLNTGTTYYTFTYRQVSAGQVVPVNYYCGQANVFGVGTAYGTTDPYWGTTVTNGADYSYTGNPTLGSAVGTGSCFGPTYATAVQLVPSAITLITGDSISFGFGGIIYEGYLGYALASGSVNFFNAGVGGSSAVNLGKYSYVINNLSQYADHTIYHVGTNDFANSFTFPAVQAAIVNIAQNVTSLGSDITFCTVFPRVTSANNFQTLAGQTPIASEPNRVQFNNWLRDPSPAGAVAYLKNNLPSSAVVNTPIDPCVYVEYGSTSGSIITLSAANAYLFYCSPATATSGSIYSNNGVNFTVSNSITSGSSLSTIGPVASLTSTNPLTSGTLSLVTGSGDATITYSTFMGPNQQVTGSGGRWIVNGTSNYATSDGIHPTATMYPLVQPSIPIATYAALNNDLVGS